MKKAMAIFALAACLSFSVIVSAPTFADGATAAKPSKESLLAAWEQAQKSSPYTVTFKETKEKGVYNFETTIFPYKGKIKVLNLLIDKKPAHYYDAYRDYGFDDPEEDYKGIVELELEGTDEKFRRKYNHSYETWDRDNALHYNAKLAMWYTPKQWADYRKTLKSAESASEAKSKKKEDGPTLLGVFISWLPMLLLIGVWWYFMHKSGTFKYKQVIERQLPHMDRTEDILKEILEAVKRK